jgi:hypothetical protein
MSELNIQILKEKLQNDFVETGSFAKISEMFTKQSLKEIGYKTISAQNLENAIEDYLNLNRKYLRNLIKNSELKDIDIEGLNQDDLNYSLFVRGVGETFKNLKKGKFTTKPKEINGSSVNKLLENENMLEAEAPPPAVEDTSSPSNIPSSEEATEIENSINLNAVEIKTAENFVSYKNKNLIDKFSTQSTNFTSTANTYIAGLQLGYRHKLYDKLHTEIDENTNLDSRNFNLKRSFINANFNLAMRPAQTPLNINGDNPNTPAQNVFSSLRLLNMGVSGKFKLEDAPVQVGFKLGPNINYGQLFKATSFLYPKDPNDCNCGGAAVCSVKDELPRYSSINSGALWLHPEYGQIANLSISGNKYDISVGFKPQGMNLDQPLFGRFAGVAATDAQRSATYNASASIISYKKDGDNTPDKESNVTTFSAIVRPNAVSRYGVATVGKQGQFGYDAGIDIASTLADAKKIGLVMFDTGLHYANKRENTLIGFSASIGKNYSVNEAGLNMFSFSVNAEYILHKGLNSSYKMIGGINISNFNHSQLLPATPNPNGFSTVAQFGVQANLFNR